MNENTASPEPSMDEILASIRKIISEDAGASPAGPAVIDPTAQGQVDMSQPMQASPNGPQEEVIELTEMVQDDGSVVSLKADENTADASLDAVRRLPPEETAEQPAEETPQASEEAPAPEAPAQTDTVEGVGEVVFDDKPTQMPVLTDEPAAPAEEPKVEAPAAPIAEPAPAPVAPEPQEVAPPAQAEAPAPVAKEPAPAPQGLGVLAEMMGQPENSEIQKMDSAEANPVHVPIESLHQKPTMQTSSHEKDTAMSEPMTSQQAAAAGLVDDKVVNMSANAFSRLSQTVMNQGMPQMSMGYSARTLEDLTKELLKPIMKEWLEENLPPLVERIVREEVERISYQGRHGQS